jgi:two-component system chemotaxis response regulator CheB
MSLRVVIVDDSALARVMLREVLCADHDIEIVGEAANGREALAVIEATAPALVTMDLDMPGMSGLDTITEIMARAPVPILVVTGERLGPDTDLGFRAIECGALDFTVKFAMSDPSACAAFRNQVRELANVPVFRHAHPSNAPTSLPAPMSSNADHPKVIAIASEAGGARSIATIVRKLPLEFPCAIALAQHMPLPFTRGFARFLEQHTALRVVIVGEEPVRCRAGTAYVPMDDAHLVCPSEGMLRARKADPVNGHRPSASQLFDSLASHYGEVAVGIVLSGRGDDGAEALAHMHRAGMLTLAESDETAMALDMPHAAIRAGSVGHVMTAEHIADFLLTTMMDKKGATTAPPPFPLL